MTSIGYENDFSSRLERAWKLIHAYSYLENDESEKVETLAKIMLDFNNIKNRNCPGTSGLNADQAPLQLCITSGTNTVKNRLIADSASDEKKLPIRFERAKNALWNILAHSNAQGIKPLVETLLDNFGPKNEREIEIFTYGVFWIAASLKDRGAAIYLDASAYSSDNVWIKTKKLFYDLTKNHNTQGIIQKLENHCWISSVGMEGYDLDKCKLKLYLHGNKDLPKGFLGNIFPPFSILGKSKCFQILLRDLGIPASEIYYNLGFHTQNGQVIDGKIDISAKNLKLDYSVCDEIINMCCQRLNLKTIPVKEISQRFNLALSFIGLGVKHSGEPRINVYFKGDLTGENN